MSIADELESDYESMLTEYGISLTVKRKASGSAGSVISATVRARIYNYVPSPGSNNSQMVVAGIAQGLFEGVLLYKDLVTGGFPVPIQKNAGDYIQIGSDPDIRIIDVDNNTGRVGAKQIFVKIACKGGV